MWIFARIFGIFRIVAGFLLISHRISRILRDSLAILVDFPQDFRDFLDFSQDLKDFSRFFRIL